VDDELGIPHGFPDPFPVQELGDQITCDNWFMKVVEPYSRRNLTLRKDKLVAIGGLARLVGMQSRLDTNYVAGMWRSHLISQLAWQSRGATVRGSPFVAPTWSWASVDGPVSLFPLIPSHLEGVECVKVHDIQVILASTVDPFGEILSARLRLQCDYLLRYKASLRYCSERYGLKIWLYTDELLLEDINVQIYLLPLSIRQQWRLPVANRGLRLVGLLLAANGIGKGQYVRL
jgi:hypothetical protein